LDRTIWIHRSRSFTLQPLKTICRRSLASGVALGALLAGSAATVASAAPATPSAGSRSLQKRVDALVGAGVPGVVLVARRGERVSQLAGGLAEVRSRTPIRVGDRFRTGSLTKTYVATVALQLAAEGKLGLDDAVERWLPGLVPNGAAITIRQLLNHSSGVPEFDEDPRVLKPYLAGNLRYYWSPRALVAIATSHEPAFAPGTRYSYSNTNYLLIGLIVEAVTGHALASELEARIFVPLHLKTTSLPVSPGLAAPYAHGYFTLAKPPASDISGLSPYPWAAGAIVASGADTATFYRALLQGKLLQPEQLAAMKRTLSEGAKADLEGSRYGLGLESLKLSCGRAWGHGGNFPGYLVYTVTSDDGDRQAVLLVNEDPSSLPDSVGPKFFKLLDRAYCGAA
jgi:D-alanyl-D-alanine carboxypeptidase